MNDLPVVTEEVLAAFLGALGEAVARSDAAFRQQLLREFQVCLAS